MRSSRCIRSLVFSAFCVLLAASMAFADDRGEGPLNPAPPNGITPEQIIQKFAAREKEFETARDDYTYRQTVKVDELDGDTVDGEYQITFDVLFDDQGRKIENVVYAPQPTLKRVIMTAEDEQIIRNLLPFVLTTEEIPDYEIKYAGQQKEDELNTYVFDIDPKKLDPNKQRFQGRIWVDDHDFQVVKTYGKPVPEIHKKNNENLFPKFTTYREQIDGQYWFPTYTMADDVLQFKDSPEVHIREVVRYTNYKRFRSTHRIIFDGQEVPPANQPKPQGQQQPQSPQQ